MGFKPEKARRAAEKIKNREALDTYIRKWYAALTHDRVEFSQYELLTWKMRRKDKWVRAHKNRARKAAEQAQMIRALGDPALSITGSDAPKNICAKEWRTSAHNPLNTPLNN